MKIYALLGESGTAVSETALCEIHRISGSRELEIPSDLPANSVWADCSDNPELECQVCGGKARDEDDFASIDIKHGEIDASGKFIEDTKGDTWIVYTENGESLFHYRLTERDRRKLMGRLLLFFPGIERSVLFEKYNPE